MAPLNDFYLIGQPPELRAKPVQALLGEVLQDGINPPTQEVLVHLLIEGQWWRLFVDGPHLYWKRTQDNQAPIEWDLLPEHEFWVKVRDLGAELNVNGALLESWSFGIQNNRPRASLNFQDGRQLTFSCAPEWMGFTTIEMVELKFS
ncbi:hypothetical protein [Deinococcus hohokamensis]|uniref:DUF4178 domain-containing protein n=1 Tax=Deinococcus hohokamensis TaxID=309883 RepID=A0ABV9I7B7_9DEIO